MSDMRTPLNRVRGLGSAKEGTDHFWRQRLTAIANIPRVIFFIGFGIEDAAAACPALSPIGIAVVVAMECRDAVGGARVDVPRPAPLVPLQAGHLARLF